MVKLKIVHTDGGDPDFISLCRLLDAHLNEAVGGAIQREQYDQYNQLNDIHDVVLIYDEKTPVACGSFKFYGKGIAEIKRVFVRDEYRGRGLSKKLMGELEKKALKAGYDTFYLETGNILKTAMGLYKSIGFQVRDNYGPYVQMSESVCMEKKLS